MADESSMATSDGKSSYKSCNLTGVCIRLATVNFVSSTRGVLRASSSPGPADFQVNAASKGGKTRILRG